MRVLALDTTTRAGSVAIVEDDRVIAERAGDDGRTHAERLPAEIVDLVAATGLTLADIDLLAVASGPGSFTGLRIGIAAVQGLAMVLRRRVVAVPSLDALAQIGSRGLEPPARVAAWMDAHRRDVFAACYDVGAAQVFAPERLVAVEGPTVGEPAAALERWSRLLDGAPVVFIGDGGVLYADLIARAAPGARVMPAPPLAAAIGLIAVARARRGDAVDPSAVQPLYVRRPDAEVERERRSR
ncbi:MAG: tRNA (adenosine(37)-N6)-threonylcarbamoyltransferase complex dimerization subunit type 1 TsaB [Vicinamibacterales bacterium]